MSFNSNFYRQAAPGPYGFIAYPDGSRRLNAEGLAFLGPWLEAYNQPRHLAMKCHRGMCRMVLAFGETIEDLDSLGNIAFIHAAIKFDPTRDVNFLTVVGWEIKNQLNQRITYNQRGMRCGHNTFAESDSQYEESDIVSLGKNTRSVLETMADRETIEESFATISRVLDQRERIIFCATKGIGPWSISIPRCAISEAFSITQERTRQILNTCREKLRKATDRPQDQPKEQRAKKARPEKAVRPRARSAAV